MAKRRLASTAMLVRYGQSGWVCGWLVSIELSIARWIRIGIEIEISVYMNEHESAKTPSFHCSRQSRSRRRKVGSMPRSGGSTGFTYVDMAKRPVAGPLARRHEPPPTIPAWLGALGLFPELRVGHHAAPTDLRAFCGRIEVRLRGRLRQWSRGRRIALGLCGIANWLRLGGNRARQPRALLLELDAQPGELPLDLSDLLLALVEPLPLR